MRIWAKLIIEHFRVYNTWDTLNLQRYGSGRICNNYADFHSGKMADPTEPGFGPAPNSHTSSFFVYHIVAVRRYRYSHFQKYRYVKPIEYR
jgi:hypothetical protein